jgi:hypothetical protein
LGARGPGVRNGMRLAGLGRRGEAGGLMCGAGDVHERLWGGGAINGEWRMVRSEW